MAYRRMFAWVPAFMPVVTAGVLAWLLLGWALQ